MGALLAILGALVGAIALYAWATDRANVRRANTPPLLESDDTRARDELMREVAPEDRRKPC